MLLAGLTSTARKSKKIERTLTKTILEMEVISQCRSGGLDDYKPPPPRTNVARLKLEGTFDVQHDSVLVGDPVSGYLIMLKVIHSERGHLVAWR